MKMLVAMRFQGEEKELFRLGVNKKGDFYIFFSHAEPPPVSPALERHVSYHVSGVLRQKASISGKEILSFDGLRLQPPMNLQGVELLIRTMLFMGQFQTLRPLRPSRKGLILLDADSAHFTDDAILFRVYLVEPNQESRIPVRGDVGPRILHVEKTTTPWIVVEAFQQRLSLKPSTSENK